MPRKAQKIKLTASLPSSELTPQQEQFAQLFANGTIQYNAYKIAYNQPTMSNAVASRYATAIKNNPTTQKRIRELQQENCNASMKTREELIKRLEEIAFKPRYEAKDAIKAIAQLCQMQGYNQRQIAKQQINVQYIESNVGAKPTERNREKPPVIEDCEMVDDDGIISVD
jgi:DNA-binding protein H-NS